MKSPTPMTTEQQQRLAEIKNRKIRVRTMFGTLDDGVFGEVAPLVGDIKYLLSLIESLEKENARMTCCLRDLPSLIRKGMTQNKGEAYRVAYTICYYMIEPDSPSHE